MKRSLHPAWVVAMVAWQGQLRDGLKTSRPVGHLIRSVVGVTAMVLKTSLTARMSRARSFLAVCSAAATEERVAADAPEAAVRVWVTAGMVPEVATVPA